MSKRGFYKLMVFAIAVVIIAIAYRLLTVTPRTSESLHKLNQSTHESGGSSLDEADSMLPDAIHNRIAQITQETLATEEPQEDNEINNQVELILEELKPHKFSEDPFIEAYTLGYEAYFCSEQAVKDQHNPELPMEPQLIDLFEQARKDCDVTRARYPHLVSLKDSYNIIKNIPPTTAAGRAIKTQVPDSASGQQYYRDQLNNRLKHALQSKIGPIIAETGLASYFYFQNGETMPVSQWLNSQDIEYNRQVMKLALGKLACRYQDGMACQPTSSQMFMLCINDKTACGLDFNTFYQQTVMPGMQKDVEILIEKFAAMSEQHP